MSLLADKQPFSLTDNLTQFCMLHNTPLVAILNSNNISTGTSSCLICLKCNPQILLE